MDTTVKPSNTEVVVLPLKGEKIAAMKNSQSTAKFWAQAIALTMVALIPLIGWWALPLIPICLFFVFSANKHAIEIEELESKGICIEDIRFVRNAPSNN